MISDINITSELLDHRLNREIMRGVTDEYAAEGIHAVKFAVAALVLDNSGNVLVCYHDARMGESEEGAIGSVTETLRYLQEYNDQTETPAEALKRCLAEEHGIEGNRLQKAGFFFDRVEPIFFGEWPVGEINGKMSTYPSFNVVVRVANPDIFKTKDRPSEEILATEFRHVESLSSNEAKRPGYNEWLQTMIRFIGNGGVSRVTEIQWPTTPVTGRDARYPY